MEKVITCPLHSSSEKSKKKKRRGEGLPGFPSIVAIQWKISASIGTAVIYCGGAVVILCNSRVTLGIFFC